MSITTTEHCQHGHHFVKADKITWLYLENGGRRRICEDCKRKIEEVKKNSKKTIDGNQKLL